MKILDDISNFFLVHFSKREVHVIESKSKTLHMQSLSVNCLNMDKHAVCGQVINRNARLLLSGGNYQTLFAIRRRDNHYQVAKTLSKRPEFVKSKMYYFLLRRYIRLYDAHIEREITFKKPDIEYIKNHMLQHREQFLHAILPPLQRNHHFAYVQQEFDWSQVIQLLAKDIEKAQDTTIRQIYRLFQNMGVAPQRYGELRLLLFQTFEKTIPVKDQDIMLPLIMDLLILLQELFYYFQYESFE